MWSANILNAVRSLGQKQQQKFIPNQYFLDRKITSVHSQVNISFKKKMFSILWLSNKKEQAFTVISLLISN